MMLTLAPITEKDFRQAILDLCRYTGWKYYFSWTSIHSPAGFPDLLLVRGSELIAAELKSERGRVTPAQQGWIDALSRAGIEVHVWRPADFNAIVARLEARCAAASCYNEHKVTLALASRKDDQP